MTSELTQIVNLVKSKMKKLKMYLIKKCTKLELVRKIVIHQYFLILKVF